MTFKSCYNTAHIWCVFPPRALTRLTLDRHKRPKEFLVPSLHLLAGFVATQTHKSYQAAAVSLCPFNTYPTRVFQPDSSLAGALSRAESCRRCVVNDRCVISVLFCFYFVWWKLIGIQMKKYVSIPLFLLAPTVGCSAPLFSLDWRWLTLDRAQPSTWRPKEQQRRYAEIILIFSRWDFTSLSANMYTLWLAAALQFKLRSITIHTQYKTLFFYPTACSVVAVDEELNFVRNKADDARQKHSWKWHHDREPQRRVKVVYPARCLFFLLFFLCLSLSLNVERAKISNS